WKAPAHTGCTGGGKAVSKQRRACRFGIALSFAPKATRKAKPSAVEAADPVMCGGRKRTPNLRRMRQRRRARVRVHSRAVSNYQKSSVVGSHRRYIQQQVVSARPGQLT